MKKNIDPYELLLINLEKPLHITYICDSIFRVGINETRKRIDQLVKDGLIEESKYGKDYYVRTKRNG